MQRLRLRLRVIVVGVLSLFASPPLGQRFEACCGIGPYPLNLTLPLNLNPDRALSMMVIELAS